MAQMTHRLAWPPICRIGVLFLGLGHIMTTTMHEFRPDQLILFISTCSLWWLLNERGWKIGLLCGAARGASLLIHEEAKRPRTKGTVPVNLTVAAFRMGAR